MLYIYHINFSLIFIYQYFYISPEKPQCPEKHIYKECGLSNPATCSNVAPFQDSECVSGCTCPEGNNIYSKRTDKEVTHSSGVLSLTRYLMNSLIHSLAF